MTVNQKKRKKRVIKAAEAVLTHHFYVHLTQDVYAAYISLLRDAVLVPATSDGALSNWSPEAV